MKVNAQIKKNVIVYYLSLTLITISISLPHAILTLVFLSKGVSVQEMLLVQTTYSIAILIFEFPSGLIADMFSKKTVFIISKLIYLIMLIVVLLKSGLFWMTFAWVLYGIASALDSGTIDSQIIVDLKKYGYSKQVTPFVKNDNILNLTSLLVGSFLGSILYPMIKNDIYIISILLVITLIISVSLFYRNIDTNESVKTKSLKKQVTSSFSELVSNQKIRQIIILNSVGQIFFQTHYQMWQAYLLKVGVPSSMFGIVYLVFQIIGIIAYQINIQNFSNILLKFAFGSLVGLIIMVLSKNIFLIMIGYIFFVGIFSIIDATLTKRFAISVSNKNISSLTSLKSTTGRISSVIILGLSSLAMNYLPITTIITLNFSLSIILLSIFWIISWKKDVTF